MSKDKTALTKPEILTAVALSFDLFSRERKQGINEYISRVFGKQPSVSHVKHTVAGPHERTYESSVYRWPLGAMRENVEKLYSEAHQSNSENAAPYIQDFVIEAHENPVFPGYLVLVKFELNGSALTALGEIRSTVFGIVQTLRLFVQQLKGYSNRAWRPSTPAIVEIGVVVSHSLLEGIRQKCVELRDAVELSRDSEVALKLSQSLRELEPYGLVDKAFEIRSHLIGAQNVHHVLGLMTQPALGGLLTPYLLTLTTNSTLLQTTGFRDRLGIMIPTNLSSIAFHGYQALLPLLILNTWLPHILQLVDETDGQLSSIRKSLVNLDLAPPDKLRPVTVGVSEQGASVASKLGELGRVSRSWGKSIDELFENKSGVFYWEVPVLSSYKQPMLSMYLNFINAFGGRGGIIGMMAYSASILLSVAKSALVNQEGEISSLGRHLHDLISLGQTRVIERLTRRLEWLTMVLVFLTGILVVLGVLRK